MMDDTAPHQESDREEALRTHLLNNIESSTLVKASASGEHPGENNIDPAISSLHVISSHLAGNAPVAPVAPVGHLSQNHLTESGENTPVIGTYSQATSMPHGDHDGSRKKAGKRELSTSKRAAQNRAAQRAFRQRKEGYIKKLEEQVRDFGVMEEQYKAIQAENYSLRAYIISLQSRLIESQGEDAVPPPPNHLLGNSQQVQSTPKQAAVFDTKSKNVAHSAIEAGVVGARTYEAGPDNSRDSKDDEAYNSFLAKRLNGGDDSAKGS
ncbi:hypothetical protein BJ508DRAFT_414575 [Ascobolus immersus RN42]|uniref:Putative transcription factor kapC n=1 Tax=Ascobolus immersus RN42 TaxID=1160509 RepID=A0A3N4I708_ASCIM|nr:hypothetical protein BJ508DRAFT_414575 [Ascobolus immersus RN42]